MSPTFGYPFTWAEQAKGVARFFWGSLSGLHCRIEKSECEDVMNRTQWIEDFQKNLSDLIARSPAADLERNVKAVMGQAFTKMDLITREEFDVQAELLARARERVDQLAAQVEQLEARVTALESKQA